MFEQDIYHQIMSSLIGIALANISIILMIQKEWENKKYFKPMIVISFICFLTLIYNIETYIFYLKQISEYRILDLGVGNVATLFLCSYWVLLLIYIKYFEIKL